MIEQYIYTGEGYNPYLIGDKWQVAKLNYLPGHGFDDMSNVEVHKKTDEVFILLKGRAVLVTANMGEKEVSFELADMQPCVTYNIPRGVWHNIGMSEDAEIIIVEDAQTHTNDVGYFELTDSSKNELTQIVHRLMNV